MRLFRKRGSVCQNCVFGNNEKAFWKPNIFRRNAIGEEGFWHIYCDKKKKYLPWDQYKRCFIRKTFIYDKSDE